MESWKMISSPFGIIPIFRGELLVSGNVYIYNILEQKLPNTFCWHYPTQEIPDGEFPQNWWLLFQVANGALGLEQVTLGLVCYVSRGQVGGSWGDTQSQGVTWVTGKTRKPRKPQTLRWMLLPVQKGPKHLPRISFEGKIWLLGVVLEMNQDG